MARGHDRTLLVAADVLATQPLAMERSTRIRTHLGCKRMNLKCDSGAPNTGPKGPHVYASGEDASLC